MDKRGIFFLKKQKDDNGHMLLTFATFMLFMLCVCCAFVHVCILLSCGHLLGKG